MAKARVHFLCNHCGAVHPKWMGKCPDCGTWDSLEEYKTPTTDTRKASMNVSDFTHGAAPVRVTDIQDADTPRIRAGIGEFDRILGGGIVPGSVTLVGGEPGIGKSTLLLQVAGALSGNKKSDLPGPILYVTSEESARQTKLRASRLGVVGTSLLVLAETNLERIVHQIQKTQPAVVVIDSIQMIYKPSIPAAPGSVTQLRDGCMELVYLAKTTGIGMLLVGHVTKAGTLAGPKIVEHIVDTVVYFEGDRFHSHRLVRCVKNRFGSTHEVGLFEMTGNGLREVTDPGNLFFEQYGTDAPPSGSVITAAMQGTRVLLLEVQALTAASVIGAAKRKAAGVSADRLAMIIAVLEKRAELRLAADDVFINIAGGVKVIEPGIDLAIALAIASAHLNRPIGAGTLVIGELGLGGEIRPVPQLDQRLREASRLGLSSAIIPRANGAIPRLKGMSVLETRRLHQALASF